MDVLWESKLSKADTHLMAFFPGELCKPAPERKTMMDFNEARYDGHQLDHLQIICTLLQTGNYAITSSLTFYRTDALPDGVKALKEFNHKIQ